MDYKILYEREVKKNKILNSIKSPKNPSPVELKDYWDRKILSALI